MNNTAQKILGFGDITILTFIANFGIRWLAVAAGMGAPSILFWIIGAVFLAFPLAFMSAQLCRLYPYEGGIYAWVRHSLGEKSGFIVAWLYLLNNVFYYPAILIFLATNFSYFLDKPELANNNHFVCAVVLIFFWLVVLISLFGLKMNKCLTEYGGIFGGVIPALLIIGLGCAFYIVTKQSATLLSWHAMLPTHQITHTLVNLTMIMFAITGVEVIPTFANAVKNPKRDLYFGLILGTALLIVFYILGTIALNVILSPDDIHKTSGLMLAFHQVFLKFHLSWLTRIVAFMLIFAELSAVSIWLIAPITMFFKCTPKGLLPNWFHKTNKNDAPVNAILFIGLLVTVILLATNLLPAVNDMYQILILMCVLLVFIPYFYLVAAYVKNIKKIPGGRFTQYFFIVSVLISLILGVIFSFALPADIKTLGAKILYETELFFGPFILVSVGYVIYYLWDKKNNNNNGVL